MIVYRTAAVQTVSRVPNGGVGSRLALAVLPHPAQTHSNILVENRHRVDNKKQTSRETKMFEINSRFYSNLYPCAGRGLNYANCRFQLHICEQFLQERITDGFAFRSSATDEECKPKGYPHHPTPNLYTQEFSPVRFSGFPAEIQQPSQSHSGPGVFVRGHLHQKRQVPVDVGITDLRRDAQLTKVCSPYRRSRPQRPDVPARPLPILENGKIASGKVISLASVYPWEHSFCFTFR